MRHRAVIAATLLGLVAAACGGGDGPGASDGAHHLAVVASFYPLAEAAERVGGDFVTVRNLTPPGVEPHDLELAPDDLEALVTADVVVYISGGFQPAVEDGIGQADGRLVDVLDAVPTIPPPEGEGELSADPHVWLDPELYSQLLLVLAEALAAVEPNGADQFRANAEGFASELAALDGEFVDGLAKCRSRTLVTSHAAFGYLAKAYGLEQIAISGLSPEAEPDPARMAELQNLVQAQGITTIFTEELVSPEVAEALADAAGVTTAVLSPLEGLTADEVDAGEDYVSVMRENLQTLRNALGCS